MEKVIYDEKNGLWYELQGDYYIPCLKLPEKEQQPIGIGENDICGISSKIARSFISIC